MLKTWLSDATIALRQSVETATGAGHLRPAAAEGRRYRTCLRDGHRGAASAARAVLRAGPGTGDAACAA